MLYYNYNQYEFELNNEKQEKLIKILVCKYIERKI